MTKVTLAALEASAAITRVPSHQVPCVILGPQGFAHNACYCDAKRRTCLLWGGVSPSALLLRLHHFGPLKCDSTMAKARRPNKSPAGPPCRHARWQCSEHGSYAGDTGASSDRGSLQVSGNMMLAIFPYGVLLMLLLCVQLECKGLQANERVALSPWLACF